MANKKVKDLNPSKSKKDAPEYFFNEYEEFKGLLMNAFTIEGITNAAIEKYVKNVLIENNVIGYDRLTETWGVVTGTNKNIYDAPTQLRFILGNGKTFTRKAFYEPAVDGAYKIEGIPAGVTFSEIITSATSELLLCDSMIRQNLRATRVPSIIAVEDPDTRLSVEHAVQQAQQGIPVIKVSKAVAESLHGVNLSTPYIVDRIYAYRQMRRDALINKLGTMSANINKRERVQVGEVNATVGQCEDYIYMLIDNLNKQFKSYNLPFDAKLNNSLEELYGNQETIETEESNSND